MLWSSCSLACLAQDTAVSNWLASSVTVNKYTKYWIVCLENLIIYFQICQGYDMYSFVFLLTVSFGHSIHHQICEIFHIQHWAVLRTPEKSHPLLAFWKEKDSILIDKLSVYCLILQDNRILS